MHTNTYINSNGEGVFPPPIASELPDVGCEIPRDFQGVALKGQFGDMCVVPRVANPQLEVGDPLVSTPPPTSELSESRIATECSIILYGGWSPLRIKGNLSVGIWSLGRTGLCFICLFVCLEVE